MSKENQKLKGLKLSEFVAESQLQQAKQEMSLIRDIFGGRSEEEEELRKDIDYDLKDTNQNNLDADTSEWEEDWMGVERPEGKQSGSDSHEDHTDDDDHDGGEMMPIMTSF